MPFLSFHGWIIGRLFREVLTCNVSQFEGSRWRHILRYVNKVYYGGLNNYEVKWIHWWIEKKKMTKKLMIEPRRLLVIALHGQLQIVFLKVLVWSKRHTLLILSWNSEEFPVYFFWPINKIQFRLQKTWNPKSSKFYRKTTGAFQAACHWLTHSCQMLSQKLPWRLQNLLLCGLTQGIIFILKTRARASKRKANDHILTIHILALRILVS